MEATLGACLQTENLREFGKKHESGNVSAKLPSIAVKGT